MTTLLVDAGNSSCKYALALDGRLTACGRRDGSDPVGEICSLFGPVKPDVTVVSSVRRDDVDLVEGLSSCFGPVKVLDYRIPLPIKLEYDTPETLGSDRIAAAVGAYSIFHGRDILIFDFGTAITIDRVTSEGFFAGGNISLGLSSRLKALHLFTGRLPEVSPGDVPIGGLGCDTGSALASGAVSGTMFEIAGYIEHFPGHIVVFSGGDSIFLAKRMKNPIFADCNLVLRGLAHIAEYER